MNGAKNARVLTAVYSERLRQEALRNAGKFAYTCADRWSGDEGVPIPPAEKLAVLAEEFGEVARAVCELQPGDTETRSRLRDELIQVAAVAVAWVESLEEA